MSAPRLIVALDFADSIRALQFVEQLSPDRVALKVGSELFTLAGPSLVKSLVAKGFRVFLDLKFHDIPNTVTRACQVAADMGVWMLNVHASGGLTMMQSVQSAMAAYGQERPLVIAVTVLTSMSEAELVEVGCAKNLISQVNHLTGLVKSAGLDGIVCSAREAGAAKQIGGSDFITVTPGIRPKDSQQDDQHRIMTPEEAIQQGSDYLVVGRPITRADDPLAVIDSILDDIEYAG